MLMLLIFLCSLTAKEVFLLVAEYRRAPSPNYALITIHERLNGIGD